MLYYIIWDSESKKSPAIWSHTVLRVHNKTRNSLKREVIGFKNCSGNQYPD